jgi:periplasmic protein CpxP/Spy
MKFIGTATLALFILSTVNCFKEKNFEARVEKIANKISKHLDLNDKQKVELERIKKEIIEKKKSLREKSPNESREQLIGMIRTEKMDLAKAKATMDISYANRKEMGDFMIEKLVEFHAILTPEQRTKFADKMESFSKKMKRYQ